MKRKVYGGILYIGGKQYRAIVCCTSRLRASQLTKLSVACLKEYWSETENKDEIYTAHACPDTVLVKKLNSTGPLKAYSP